MPRKGPVRLGRGRLDSLRKRGVAAYLITPLQRVACSLIQYFFVIIELAAISLSGLKRVRVSSGVRVRHSSNVRARAPC
jgi:hypothetical protein